MRVRSLPLSDDFVAHFESRGITELYPPQAAAVEAGVCDGNDVVAAVPTAAGKTFVAQLAMLTADGPGLYIVPLRALAREKHETFSSLPGVSVGISTGDFDSPAEELGDHDVVVATSEKVDSAIRNGAQWVEELAAVVVDEVHLLGTERRGPTLEVTLGNLRRRTDAAQVVALSATVDNPGDVADWLDADLVESSWRPVSLRAGVFEDWTVGFDDGTELSLSPPADVPDRDDEATAATVELVADALDGGNTDRSDADVDAEADADTDAHSPQCLAFVRSRAEAEQLAERLAAEGLGSAPGVAGELEDVGAAETGRRLADCVREGVAFHHAGLRSAHRAAVEAAFRDRKLAVICATPTLAAGVNVPARRVVVRDLERYTGSEMAPLPVLEVHQMMGRAGRPGLDPYGEAVLVGDPDADDPEALADRYLAGDPERVTSKLADREALRTHVLSLVASGFAADRAGVLDALDATFYAYQRAAGAVETDADLDGEVDAVVADLAEMEMITRDGDGLAATNLGERVSKQYVSPDTGAAMVDGLTTAAEMTERSTLTVFEVVCDTPDMQDTYLGNRERASMYDYATSHAAELTTDPTDPEDFEAWLESVKTARILTEWVDGASVADLVERYRVGPGDLESRVERAEWLLGAADALARLLDLELPEIERARARL
ncbi:MAG: DEAD/DEAH box helicase [Halolamina sp.]